MLTVYGLEIRKKNDRWFLFDYEASFYLLQKTKLTLSMIEIKLLGSYQSVYMLTLVDCGSEFSLFLWWRRWPTRLHHILKHPVFQSANGLVFNCRKVHHSWVMRNMTGKCISPEIGAILPLGAIRIASACNFCIEVFDLVLERESFVHLRVARIKLL